MCANSEDISGSEMRTAYRVAQELLKDRLEMVDKDAYKQIKDVQGDDLIVVDGQYDFIGNVLAASGIPFRQVGSVDVETINFRSDQTVFINCPGVISSAGLAKLHEFVTGGGFLFTTDWALRNVLEPAFPGYVRYNNRRTGDEVVRVEFPSSDDPFIKLLISAQDDPQWWLESSSYPIEIIDEKRVSVMVSSKEIGNKYGASAVFVAFDHGNGKVYHMISHFYLQRSETRTQRHMKPGADYLDEKGIPAALRAKYAAMGIGSSKLSDVESAFTSTAMMNKVLFDRKKKR